MNKQMRGDLAELTRIRRMLDEEKKQNIRPPKSKKAQKEKEVEE